MVRKSSKRNENILVARQKANTEHVLAVFEAFREHGLPQACG
ncbi:MAG TPA: hypothetical protein VKT33_12920 [Candidatus Angelobacter sp.]|nr:hypothetical protein [Candidatus Angelobacter sp.]